MASSRKEAKAVEDFECRFSEEGEGGCFSERVWMEGKGSELK